MISKKILVTGGAGYIGSHACVELQNAGYDLVVLDNLSNSKFESLERVKRITGRELTFHQVDICNKKGLSEIFDLYEIDAVIHFAGLKSVRDSVERPLSYYNHNVAGSIALCEVMAEKGVRKLVFSSSATVYQETNLMPIREDFPVGESASSYGSSKLMIENILQDLQLSDPSWRISILRYFNPVGAHFSGLIGEDPKGIPNNLMPLIAQVAAGERDFLSIYGDDYSTKDGTGVRDYIHVVDLAKGHIAALTYLSKAPGLLTVNLGTGQGLSVLEMVNAFQRATGIEVPHRFFGRRAGDLACYYADSSLAADKLGWRAELGVEAMCLDTWRWQVANMNGFEV
jgi:UDP-glucose 4-epimerase